MDVIKPPNNLYENYFGQFSIFAGGSIEQGKAEMWQDRLAEELKDVQGVIFNPRRDNWDASLEQRISNPVFKEQVDWEFAAIELAHKLFFYFDPNTLSPITIGEVYMIAPTVNPQDIVVVCPDGFWRKGNIEHLCDKFGIPLLNSFEEGIDHIMPIKLLNSN